MTNSMDSYVSKGQSDVQNKLKDGVDEISRIGDEFKGVKDQLQDMPGGLDEDLQEMIRDAEKQGLEEAQADIESTKASIIDEAKTTADSIKDDVQNKISDNTSARGKLDGISGKYGKDAISHTKSAIDENTKKGEELLKALDDAIRKADNDIQTVKDNM